MIVLLTEKCVLKVIDEAHPKNTQIYFITARWKSAQSKGRPPNKGVPLTKGVPGCFEMDSIQKSTATQTDAPVANDGSRFLISRDNSRG